MDIDNLRKLSYQCLLNLATEEGIYASDKNEAYSCIFGRDSAITVLKIFRIHSKNPSLELLEICRRTLLTLVNLQGKEFNIESGEEPGKFIHEFRDTPEKMQRLLTLEKPWYVYPDNTIKNYDSIDSTPLSLIAIYKYWQITGDNEFLVSVLPAVEAGLNWIITFGDMDKDLFIEYDSPSARKFGGLMVQSWTDSDESIKDEKGRLPRYPIAPVEAQSYAWLAMKLWSAFYQYQNSAFSRRLSSQARKLKVRFNKKFIFREGNHLFAAQALDGMKDQVRTITANPLLCLWATYENKGKKESIIDENYIEELVSRSFKEDMFNRKAGMRTMSTKSATFNPRQDSYHNGSFWPILNGLIHEGLEYWGFNKEAEMLREASLLPIEYFGTPIELYISSDNGDYLEYRSSSGQVSCRKQAWSAAATLDFLT